MSGEALTIGEVIGRLAPDFPDLTVSKIRYLESGGLISPERTPAGYRRFSEDDVEKLRWVLAAQRDQYLPLKVIRQHLAADGPRPAGDDPEGIVAALTSGTDLGRPDPDLDRDGEPTGGATGSTAAPSAGSTTGSTTERTTGSATGPSAGSSAGSSASSAGPSAGREMPALPAQASLTPPLPPVPRPRSRAVTIADPEFYESSRADVGELHLGREGLAHTAGVPGSFVADLISYGLLPHSESYGGDAVFIVRAASALTEFGLEPRHLRPLLTGARNAAGLLEGVLPVRRHDGVASAGRQAAASRAAARSAEASAAAVKLYAALLRAEVSNPTAPTPPMPPAGSRDYSGNPGMPGGPAAR